MFQVPDEYALLAFFGAEPIERAPADGCWCYEFTDRRGVTLRFSFNIFQQSVQTTVLAAGVPVSTMSHEGAERLRVDSDRLNCRFSLRGAESTLSVQLGDQLGINWTILRTE